MCIALSTLKVEWEGLLNAVLLQKGFCKGHFSLRCKVSVKGRILTSTVMKRHILKPLLCLLENRKMNRKISWRLLLISGKPTFTCKNSFTCAHKNTHILKILSLEVYMFLNSSTSFFFYDFFLDTISLARAEEDYNAPDCRFINIKKGQLIYVYSKLVKEKDSGEFWAGSVRGDSCVYEQTRTRLTHISVKKWILMLSYCGF